MSEQEARALEDLLFDLREVIEQARMMPMSASVLVNRDEALAIIEEALAVTPEELRRARWLLKERDEFLTEARRDAGAIVDAARTQAERMVERTEIAREARRTAEQVIADAEADARLLTFEETLEKTLTAVRHGRDRLQPDVDPLGGPVAESDAPAAEREFFDQDEV